MKEEIKEQIKLEEGYRKFPYLDTVGKSTVGYGRNLSDVGINEEEASVLLDNDVSRVIIGLQDKLSYFDSLDSVRQDVLIDMAFNMGISGLLKFHQTLLLISIHDFDGASVEMLKSIWAEQVKGRAKRLSEMMRTGQRG